LEKRFGDKIEVNGTATPEMTGFFEVEIVSLKKVVHSKKEGDGYVDSEAKKEAIAKAIEEALK